MVAIRANDVASSGQGRIQSGRGKAVRVAVSPDDGCADRRSKKGARKQGENETEAGKAS